mmetsp:Transcript_14622/g.23217  ORF Transcript_14622/g.23217 Transcript_14622/m.23217 type:complete len:260 (-) Transcript_14622:228-1007(-)
MTSFVSEVSEPMATGRWRTARSACRHREVRLECNATMGDRSTILLHSCKRRVHTLVRAWMPDSEANPCRSNVMWRMLANSSKWDDISISTSLSNPSILIASRAPRAICATCRPACPTPTVNSLRLSLSSTVPVVGNTTFLHRTTVSTVRLGTRSRATISMGHSRTSRVCSLVSCAREVGSDSMIGNSSKLRYVREVNPPMHSGSASKSSPSSPHNTRNLSTLNEPNQFGNPVKAKQSKYIVSTLSAHCSSAGGSATKYP